MNLWRSVHGALTTWSGDASVVTVGVFDGVHRGHQYVLRKAGEMARALGADRRLPVLAITFDPPPAQVFRPDRAPPQITTTERRVALLRDAGADEVFALAFDNQMASWSPQEFIQRALVDGLNAAGVVVGEDFRFGSRAAGDVNLLRDSGQTYGFSVWGLGLDGGEKPWSSTYVRSAIASGNVDRASVALGRPHTVEGVIVEGNKRGRAMGFPTANLPASDWVAVPADGVYAGWLRRLDGADGQPMPAAVSVGTNPTFQGADRRVESYVLDTDDLELYGVPVAVAFVERIRGQLVFSSTEELITQMHRDVQATRDVLRAAG